MIVIRKLPHCCGSWCTVCLKSKSIEIKMNYKFIIPSFLRPSSVCCESWTSFFCSTTEFLVVPVPVFTDPFSEALCLSQQPTEVSLHSADDDDAVTSAAGDVVFLCLSVELEADLSLSSSSLDFCPSGDFARPSRYLSVSAQLLCNIG